MSLINFLYYTLYSSAIVGIVILSTLVFIRRKEAEYKYFVTFTLLLSAWLAVQFFAQVFADRAIIDSTTLMRLSVALSPFYALFFFFFTAERVGRGVKRTKHYVTPVIFAITSLSTPLVIHEAHASIEGISIKDGPLYYVVMLYVVAYVLLSIFYILRENRSKHAVNPSRRQANRILILGVLQALVIVSTATIFLSEVLLAQVLIPFALFLLVAIFSYAIIRHRLFDIRLVAVRALAYSFSIATIATTYSVLVFGLVNTLLGERTTFLQQTIYLIIALMLSLTFAPLKAFFDRSTRRIFYQDSYESQRVIDDFSGLLVSTVNIDDLSRLAADILKNAIKPQYIAIILPANDKKKKTKGRVIVHGTHEISREWPLYDLLSKKADKLLIQDEMYSVDKALYKAMQVSGAAIAARLETHDGSLGYIIFGTKNSGRPYTRQDIDIIHITTDELALGIQNALRFEEIRSFNHTLQERVDEATVQLRRTNAELRRLDEAKDEFVSMASHQLRTPLTSVKGYISMVLEGDAGKITAMQHRLLSEAFTSSERMVHLIGDFLNVSRLQTGKFMLEQKQVDLSVVAKQEVNSLKTTAEAHGLKLEFRAPSYFPLLYIDEGKIRQVLMNFIDNAIYYSEEGTAITIKLAVEEGNAVVQVHDTGIGVPKSEQAHLFTKFFRATNARKQRPDGTGVGLFLAKKVIVAHGGAMLFESVEGEGSTFGFRLPIKKLSAVPSDGADELKK